MENINSNETELALASWLYENDPRSYENTRKIQKFVFFYQIFSKINQQEYSLDNFKIWLFGPVDSILYGDYTYRKSEFMDAFKQVDVEINEEIAKKADFLVRILNTEEISELSHTFDYWKVPANSTSNYWNYNITADERNFSETDYDRAYQLYTMYDEKMINNVEVVHTFGKHFVLSKDDYKNLNKDQIDTLESLSMNKDLMNPVFVEVDEDGRLLID